MALRFYVDGKSWQEKMVDQEKWQKMGANIGTGLGMGVRGIADFISPVNRAYKGYLKTQESKLNKMEDIEEAFKTAVETKDPSVTESKWFGGVKEDFDAEDMAKWSDNTLRKVALNWAKDNAPEEYKGLGLGKVRTPTEDDPSKREDYTYKASDFRTKSKEDFRSDVYDPYKERQKGYKGRIKELKGGMEEGQEELAEPIPKNLLQMIKGGGFGSPAGPYNTNLSNRGGPGSPGGQYANKPDKPSSLSDIDITESDEYAKYRHGNYAIPKQYDVTDPNMFGNLLPSQQNTLLNLQPNEMEGVREYSKTPWYKGGILQRLFPGGKAGYYAGDFTNPEDMLQQQEDANRWKTQQNMMINYNKHPFDF